MGGGSVFWELVGRKCKSRQDPNVDDPQCNEFRVGGWVGGKRSTCEIKMK
jgi:hypothetical protein